MKAQAGLRNKHRAKEQRKHQGSKHEEEHGDTNQPQGELTNDRGKTSGLNTLRTT